MARTRRAALAALCSLALSVPLAHAQTGGFPVVTGAGPRYLLSAEANGAGGVTIVHVEDHRLFRTVVDADGSIHPTWPGGILLETGPISSWAPTVHAGLADDLYLAWVDDSLRVQRVSIPAGAIAPGWPPKGRTLCPYVTQYHQIGTPHLGVDAANTLRLWFDINYDMGNKVASAGVRADATVDQTCTPLNCLEGQFLNSVVESGGQAVAGLGSYGTFGGEPANSAIASWQPFGYSHRPGETGAPGSCAWFGENDGGPTLAPSSSGDVIMVYSHATLGRLAQRIAPGSASYFGGEVWTSPGVSLGAVPGLCLDGASDGAGGAFFAFWEFTPGLRTTRLQAITAGGATPPGWPANGLTIEQSATSQDFARVIDDGAGGAIAAWVRRSGQFGDDWSIHAHHALASGSLDPSWTPDGVDVATAPKRKTIPMIAKDGAGGAWFVWRDERSNHLDIYAAHYTHDGQVAPVVGAPPPDRPRTLALSPGFPNPTRGAVAFSLALPEDAHVTARVLDVAGRVVARVANGPLPAGAHTLAWNGNGEDGSAVPAGMYVFEVRAAGRVATGRVVRL